MTKQVVIIGGGLSGLFHTIFALQQNLIACVPTDDNSVNKLSIRLIEKREDYYRLQRIFITSDTVKFIMRLFDAHNETLEQKKFEDEIRAYSSSKNSDPIQAACKVGCQVAIKTVERFLCRKIDYFKTKGLDVSIHRPESMVDIDTERYVVTTDKADYPFDYLILADGASRGSMRILENLICFLSI